MWASCRNQTFRVDSYQLAGFSKEDKAWRSIHFQPFYWVTEKIQFWWPIRCLNGHCLISASTLNYIWILKISSLKSTSPILNHWTYSLRNSCMVLLEQHWLEWRIAFKLVIESSCLKCAYIVTKNVPDSLTCSDLH